MIVRISCGMYQEQLKELLMQQLIPLTFLERKGVQLIFQSAQFDRTYLEQKIKSILKQDRLGSMLIYRLEIEE